MANPSNLIIALLQYSPQKLKVMEPNTLLYVVVIHLMHLAY
jgi:hypothetical protein